MSFTYLSGVITQANEAGKSITAVASATGGVTVTVSAHGYSNGDRVVITGTTDYNGIWDISNVATNTFDIVDQAFQETEDNSVIAFNVTRTGTVARTDKDLSGLTGLTGVTTVTSSPDATNAQHVTYIIDSTRKLQIDGQLLIDPNVNTLICEAPAVTSGGVSPIEIVSGDLYLGVKEVNSNGDILYSNFTCLNFTDQAQDQFQRYYMVFASGRTMYWNGGTVRLAGAFVFLAGAYGVINSGTLYGSMLTANGGSPQIRVDAVNDTNSNRVRINNMTLDGANAVPSAVFSRWKFGNLALTIKNGLFQAFNNASTEVTLTNLDNSQNFSNADIQETSASNANADAVIVQNFARRVKCEPSDNTRYGYTKVFRQLDCPVVDANGDGITYSYYGSDINNGSRGVGPNSYDDTTDKTYSGINQTGNITDNLLVETQRVFSGDSAYTVDDRTNANDAIPLSVIGYNEQITTFAPSLIGLGDLTESVVLLPDASISESTKATVDAYTTLDDAFEWYDRAKANLYDRFAGETLVDVGRSGSQVDIGVNNWIVDSGAVSVYDFATKTIKSSTFTGGATGAGKVIIQGATAIQNARYDCDIDYNTSSLTVTDITCTGEFRDDQARTINITDSNITTIRSTQGASLIVNVSNTTITNNPDGVTLVSSTTLELTGLVAGSEVRVYEAGTTTEIDGIESSGTSFSTTITVSSVDFVVFNTQYQPIRTLAVSTTADVSIPIQQVFDRNYENP